MILLLLFCITVLYVVFIIWISKSFKIKNITLDIDLLPPCSILIPCRNDNEYLKVLLSQLNEQVNCLSSHEVIVIDDQSHHSILADKNLTNLNLKIISNNGEGKKKALLTGITESVYPTIITLDADVTIDKFWLKTLVGEFFDKKLNLLCGLIKYNSNGSFFHEFQRMESAAIVSISQAMLNKGFPATCNGANMIFNKLIFNQVGAYQMHINISSGDDDLLMHQFSKFDISKVAYSQYLETAVSTSPESDFMSFINQRIRWISKTNYYQYPYVKYINSLILLNEIVYFALIYFVLSEFNLIAFLLLLIRYSTDYYLSNAIKKFSNINTIKMLLMPFYLLYVPLIFVLRLWVKGEWKGRLITKDF